MSIRRIKNGHEILKRDINQQNIGITTLKIVAVSRLLSLSHRNKYYITVTTDKKCFIYANNDHLDNLYQDYYRLYDNYIHSLSVNHSTARP